MNAMTVENERLLAAWRTLKVKPSFSDFAAKHHTTRSRVAGLLHRCDRGGKRSDVPSGPKSA